jgi:hypothetical protein
MSDWVDQADAVVGVAGGGSARRKPFQR